MKGRQICESNLFTQMPGYRRRICVFWNVASLRLCYEITRFRECGLIIIMNY